MVADIWPDSLEYREMPMNILGGQGRQSKVDEYDVAYAGLLQLNPLLLKQHVPFSFTLPAAFTRYAAQQSFYIYFTPLNLVGETPKRFLNT